VQWVLAAVVCGVFVVAFWSDRVDAHGPIVVVALLGTVLFLIWRFMRIADDDPRR
jgi:hypothetical protein